MKTLSCIIVRHMNQSKAPKNRFLLSAADTNRYFTDVTNQLSVVVVVKSIDSSRSATEERVDLIWVGDLVAQRLLHIGGCADVRTSMVI